MVSQVPTTVVMTAQGREEAALPARRRATTMRAAAPGPYLGYSLEPVRLCYHLLTADESSSVSLEYLDDVAVHAATFTLLEQTKSATSQNPVADWAPDLWKSFANWIAAVEGGAVDLNTTRFRLYVTPPHTGELVERLSAATTSEAADEAIEAITEKLARLAKKPASYKHLRKLLEFDPAKRRTLIKQFELESAHADPVDAIRERLRSTISKEMIETCCKYAIGHAKDEADRRIRSHASPLIPAATFRETFIAFVRKHDLTRLLISREPKPTDDVIERTLAEAPVFVRQLDLIDLPREDQLRAISDYLQAFANKTKWADEGWIVRESLAEFDEALVKQHRRIQLEIEAIHEELDPRRRGRVIYSRCGQSQAKLEQREVPDHFIPGCFNDLADKLKLGWHADYQRLLKPPKS